MEKLTKYPQAQSQENSMSTYPQTTSSSGSNTSKRDYNGRFATSSPLNIRKKKRAAQQRKHKEKRKEISDKICNEYLNSFVRRGTEKDFILASRSKGPFCELFESIVKPEYRLGRNLRYARLKVFYSEDVHLRSTPAHALKLRVNPTKYHGCRLPLVSFSSEMSAVRNWITMVQQHNALLFPSVDDCFEFCKEVLRNARTTGHSRFALHRLPKNVSLDRSAIRERDLSTSTLTEDGTETRTPRPYNEARTITSAQNQSKEDLNASGEGTSADRQTSRLTVSSPRISELSQSAREDLNKSKRLKVCLEIARHDQMYTLLHMALDNSLESHFGAFSGTYLKDIAKQGEEPCELVKEILTYAHWKRYGVANQFEYDCLERRLKNTAALSDRVRLLTSTENNPLFLYKDMRWNFMKEG